MSHPVATVGREEPAPLASGQSGPGPLPQKFGTRARNVSLLGVAALAVLPVAFALRSTMSAPPAKQSADAKQGNPAKDKEKRGEQTDEKAGGEKSLTLTGPAGLRIALDSPAVILSRGKELGLDEKQRQELEKLDGSAREQARKLLTEKQRQQLGEIPPEWLSMMQMAQLQDTLQQMRRQMPMNRGGQGQRPMGQGGQMQDMMQMMRMMQQMMGQSGTGQGGMGQGGMGMMCPMMGRGGMGQGGMGQGGNGQDAMQMMKMMQQMMGQSGQGQMPMGQGGTGQGGQMQDMVQMMQLMRMMQMMNQGGQTPTGRKGN